MLYFIKSRLPEIDTSLAQVPGFTSPMRIKSSIVSPKKKKGTFVYHSEGKKYMLLIKLH